MASGPSAIPPVPGMAPAGRLPRLLAALTFLASVLAGMPAALAAVEPVGTITEIRFEGNVTLTPEQLRGKISSRVGRPLDKDQVERDRRALSSTKWFSNVESYYQEDPQRKGFILIFRVPEMPVLHEVEFIGRKNVRLKDLEENTGLKKGARADHVKAQMAVKQIERIYHDKGYEFAQVHLVEGGKPTDTRVAFEIFEGPRCRLYTIHFVGNAFASDAMLRTKIHCRPPIVAHLGGRYSPDEVESDKRKLVEYYEQNGFFEVDVEAVKKQGPNLGDLVLEFDVWEGPQYKVRNIVFEGNEKIPKDKLKEGMLLHSGMPYMESVREADLKNLKTKYGALGCIDAKIDVKPRFVEGQKGVVDLVWEIQEGEPYLVGRVFVKGNDRTRRRVLLREANMAGLVPGEPLDANRLELYKKRVTNLGYFNGNPQMGSKPLEVQIVNRRPSSQPYAPSHTSNAGLDEVIRTRLQDPGPDIPAAIEEPPAREAAPAPAPGAGAGVAPAPGGAAGPNVGPFGGDGIFDPPPTFEVPAIPAPAANGLPPAIPGPPPGEPGRRTPPVGAGEPPGNFPSLPGGNMTDPGPDRQEPFPERSWADIVTQVDEGPTGRLMFGIGANSFQGLTGNFILHESNFDIFNVPRSLTELFSGQAFRGGGQDFRIDLMPGTLINRAIVSFRDPYVFDLPIGFGAEGYYFQRIYSDWTEKRGGGRFSLGRQFGTQTYADVAVRAEDVDFTGFRLPAPADYLAASGHTSLFSIRPTLRFDNRNDPFSPNKGQYVEFAFEQYFGTFFAPKITVEGRQYIKTGSRPDGSGIRFLTLRGFFGVTGRDTPVYERFFAGDIRSMRGFAYRGVGPRVLGVNVGGLMEALGSVEYQWPWTASDKLQQVVFCDFGTVESGYQFTQFRAAVGTGLRIYLPRQMFGPYPLAFDLAFPVAKAAQDHTRNFHFFIGTMY